MFDSIVHTQNHAPSLYGESMCELNHLDALNKPHKLSLKREYKQNDTKTKEVIKKHL